MKIIKRIKHIYEVAFKYLRGAIKTRQLLFGNKYTFILNNHHIGDICYALSALNVYIKTNENRSIKVIWDNKFSEVYIAFKITSLQYMDEKTQYDIYTYLLKSKSKFVKRILNNERIIPTFTNIYISPEEQEKKSLSVMDVLVRRAFHVQKDYRPIYPYILSNNIENILGMRINKKSTILISPFAQSMDIPLTFFQEIADVFLKKGYKVFTNLSKKDDLALNGTIGIFLSLNDTYCLIQKCVGCIGVRSGFFDYVISANSLFYILYDNNYTMKKSYRLEAWQTNNDIIERYYQKYEKNESILNEIDLLFPKVN